jgi:hypothetical protein
VVIVGAEGQTIQMVAGASSGLTQLDRELVGTVEGAAG